METTLISPKNTNSSLKSLIVFSIRCLLGLFLGIVFSVVGQEVIGYGQLAIIFVNLTSVFLVLKFTKGWALTNVLILVLFVFLLFMLINAYISVAPGE